MIPSTYDKLFKKFSTEFFGADFDWKWFKAQAWTESLIDPAATSPVGAMGIMQLMPGTSQEMATKLKLENKPRDPEFNIRAGIAYDKRCWNIWKKEEGVERLRFMFASYNAGAGHIIKAQRLATVKDKWVSVGMCLPAITGKDHSWETLNYVRRIERAYKQLQGV